jgi:hypothetical protein
MFGELRQQSYRSPLEKGDHPEVDTSDYLDANGIQQYQSMIGALQWMVTNGLFDILTSVMTMSGFCGAPLRSFGSGWETQVISKTDTIYFEQIDSIKILLRLFSYMEYKFLV